MFALWLNCERSDVIEDTQVTPRDRAGQELLAPLLGRDARKGEGPPERAFPSELTY